MNARRIGITIVLLVIVGIALYAGYRYLHRPATAGAEAESGEPEVQPVAKVAVVLIKEGSVDVTTTAFGTVVAAPGEVQTFSVPFESRVTRAIVVAGQTVKAEEPLVEVEPSPDTLLQLNQARQQRDAARNQQDLAKQRLEMKLTTRQDVLQAAQALAAAELSVRSMESRGIDGKKIIHADAQGIVSRMDVQQGQIVPAGTALVETIGQNQIAVRLGVESEAANRLSVGQDVRIEPVNGAGAAFGGRIRRVTRQVDPADSTGEHLRSPRGGAQLLLNEYVRGRIILATQRGLARPALGRPARKRGLHPLHRGRTAMR